MKFGVSLAIVALVLIASPPMIAEEESGEFKPYTELRVEDLHEATYADLYPEITYHVTPNRVRALGPLFDRARNEKLQYDNGLYIYTDMHYAIDRFLYGINDEGKAQYRRAIDQWANDEPESVTAQSLRIKLLVDYAWDLRGSGYVSETSPSQMRRFRRTLDRVIDTMEEHFDVLRQDPEFLRNYITIQMASTQSTDQMQKACVEYLKVLPDDISVYNALAIACLPRWSGDPHALIDAANFAYEQTRDRFGMTAYYFIAQTSIDYDGAETVFDDYGFNLDDYLKGVNDYREYAEPDSNWMFNKAAKTLVDLGEQELAAEYFEKIDGDFAYALWNKAQFQAWERWAKGEGPKPKRKKLHDAAEAGDLEFFKRMVDRGEDLNQCTEDGETAIHIAALEEHWDLVRYLAENGAEPSISRPEETPLTEAIKAGEVETALTLLEHGANPNYAWESRNIPLWLATLEQQMEVVDAILAYPDLEIEYRGSSRRTSSLHLAVERGMPAFSKKLVDAGADVNAADGIGMNVLASACLSGKLPIVDLLLDNGAYVNRRDLFGKTPIIHASERGRADIAARLLEEEAILPNWQSDVGETALHRAAREGHVDVVRLLCTVEGIDLNLQDYENGWTALHSAVRGDSADSLLVLVEAGADASIKDNEGRTPADLARELGKNRLVGSLQN